MDKAQDGVVTPESETGDKTGKGVVTPESETGGRARDGVVTPESDHGSKTQDGVLTSETWVKAQDRVEMRGEVCNVAEETGVVTRLSCAYATIL